MNKCKIVKINISESNIETCEYMSNYLNHEKTIFQKVMIVSLSDNYISHKVKAGKKGGYIYLNYCPFCGEKIGDYNYSVDI